MTLGQYHMQDHAPRGFGEDPASCPLCEDFQRRISSLEAKAESKTPWGQILVGVTTSIVAAYFIETVIRNPQFARK